MCTYFVLSIIPFEQTDFKHVKVRPDGITKFHRMIRIRDGFFFSRNKQFDAGQTYLINIL